MSSALMMRRDYLVHNLCVYGDIFRTAERYGCKELDRLTLWINKDIRKINEWLAEYENNRRSVEFCYGPDPTFIVMGLYGDSVVDEYDVLKLEYQHLLRVTKMEFEQITQYRNDKYPLDRYPFCFPEDIYDVIDI